MLECLVFRLHQATGTSPECDEYLHVRRLRPCKSYLAVSMHICHGRPLSSDTIIVFLYLHETSLFQIEMTDVLYEHLQTAADCATPNCPHKLQGGPKSACDIKPELRGMAEAQDVIEELIIMEKVVTNQITIVQAFMKALRSASTGNSILELADRILCMAEVRRDQLATIRRPANESLDLVRLRSTTISTDTDNRVIATGINRAEGPTSFTIPSK